MKQVEIKDVYKFYPVDDGLHLPGKPRRQVKAVNGISLTLQEGEILGLIGESGCGKSTLGKILVGLEDATKGSVIINGTDSRKLLRKDVKAFYRTVQIIFQNPFDTFNPRKRIETIMMEPLREHKIGKDDEERRKMVIEALESGGLLPAEDMMKRFPHELSGGQLQRISILRAMLLEPDLLIADEPVSMLDVSVRADIINMLLEVNKTRKTTIVFISHDIALTRFVSDKVAVMYLGRIVEYGTPEQVIGTPGHPYTNALISNCASIDVDDQPEVIEIEGEPPTPIDPGPGCFFADRCYLAQKCCYEQYPGLTDLGNGHTVTCFLQQDAAGCKEN